MGEYFYERYPDFCNEIAKRIPDEWLCVSLEDFRDTALSTPDQIRRFYSGLSEKERFTRALSLCFTKGSNVTPNLLHVACAYDCVCIVERLLPYFDQLLPEARGCAPLQSILAQFRSYNCEKFLHEIMLKYS